VTGSSCAEVRETAAEYALNILPPAQRALIAAHLAGCPACREELDGMSAVGARLLELVPGTEPPLGFDHRVLSRVRGLEKGGSRTGRAARRGRRAFQRRPRLFLAVATAAAAAAVVFGTLGWMAGRTTGNGHGHTIMSVPMHEGSRDVGEVFAYRAYDGPIWVNLIVRSATGADRVTCQLIYHNGGVKGLGTFDLVGGSGTWGAPDWSGLSGVAGARLVGPDGQVLATATFPSLPR
jgi:Putative zinc-finger